MDEVGVVVDVGVDDDGVLVVNDASGDDVDLNVVELLTDELLMLNDLESVSPDDPVAPALLADVDVLPPPTRRFVLHPFFDLFLCFSSKTIKFNSMSNPFRKSK